MLRILAVWEPSDLPDPNLFDDEEADEMGMLPGSEIGSPFAVRWDRRPISEPVDLGWIGEDAQGIWTRRHPEIAFLDMPGLWHIYAEVCCGQHEITAEDYRTKSNRELEAKIAMVAAINRKHMPNRDES